MSTEKLSFIQRLMARELHRHPFAVPVVTIVILSFVSLFGVVISGARTIGAADSHIVHLSIAGKKQTVPTRASTVDDFLTRAEVTLNEGDRVEPALDTDIDDDGFRINIYRARPVTVFDGPRRIQALSAATTPRSVVVQVGIEVFPEDNLKQEVSGDVLRDQVIGEKIVIERATPANLNLYGTPIVLRTHAKTVGALLKEKNITLASGDSVQPAADTPLAPNVQVFVTRNGTQIATVEETIPKEIETIEDASLSFGARAVRQAGSDGKKLVTYQLSLQNGKEVGRQIIQEVRTLEPVKEIVARGKAFDVDKDKSTIMALAGINVDADYAYVDYIVKHESGWRPLARNPSGAYGLCQSLPGSKMASAGADWETNPVTQLRWCNGYAQARYKGWAGAYNFWLSHKYW